MGQSRRFRDAPKESGPPPITDISCQRLTLIGLDLTHIDWTLLIAIFSTIVTLSIIALYLLQRWEDL
jgi:hypothetical protein